MQKAPAGIYHGEYMMDRNIRYKATGEFRAPKRGEYYLSGAIVQAYRAPNDLTDSYWIAVPGRIMVETITTWEPLDASR